MNEELQKVIDSVPQGLQPAYELGEANQAFTLYEGPLTITESALRCQVNGKIEWRWQPSPRIFLSIKSTDKNSFDDLSSLQTREIKVEIPNASTPVPFMIISNMMKSIVDEGSFVEIGAVALGAIEYSSSSSLKRVTTHLEAV